jgi:Tol biopolymer transport system component
MINADGSGLKRLTEGPNTNTQPLWSPDGSLLVYDERTHGPRIIGFDEADTNDPSPPPKIPKFDEEGATFFASAWSPDGRHLAGYRHFPDGRRAGIVVYSFEAEEFERLTETGRSPVWLSDNRRLLYFHQGGTKLNLVDIETKQIKVLFESAQIVHYATLSPDNRNIYANIFFDDSDIWLLTLNEEQK